MRIPTMICLVALLSACASGTETAPEPRGVAKFAGDPRLGEQVSSICFASSIRGFSGATRDTVVLAEGNDHYLVETFGGCMRLRNAQQVGIAEGTGCLRQSDRLIVSESLFGEDEGGRAQTCSVKSIYKWDPKAKAVETLLSSQTLK